MIGCLLYWKQTDIQRVFKGGTMTKSLTEKWKEGELEWGLYYVKTKKDAPLFCGEITEMSLEEEITVSQDEKVESVLAPVPSYEEYKELLDLNVYEKLQKENKKLQEQLAEANKVIKSYADCDKWTNPKQILFIDDRTDLINEELASKYLKKWGVK